MSNWYVTSRLGNPQGLIACEETGRNIAVAYDASDAPVIAAAPAMLAALVEVSKCPDAMAALTRMGMIEGGERNYGAEVRAAIALAQGER